MIKALGLAIKAINGLEEDDEGIADYCINMMTSIKDKWKK
jgi:hypothetical protein